MSNSDQIEVPQLAVDELYQVEQMDAEFTLVELVDWVNNAVERFYPKANQNRDKRVSNVFTVRTLRHYQTLECLDTPSKIGRTAIYGFRHYLQALLIRKFLFVGCSPEGIRRTLQGLSNSQYKELLFTDIKITQMEPTALLQLSDNTDCPVPSSPESWIRYKLCPDLELSIKKNATKLTQHQRESLLLQVDQLLQ